MSSCWKCGRDLPDPQTECEFGCGEAASEIEAEAALAQELLRGTEAALACARHLHSMNGDSGQITVALEGQKYLVFVKRVEGK